MCVVVPRGYGQRVERGSVVDLSSVVIGSMRKQHDTCRRPRTELGTHSCPPRTRRIGVRWQVRTKLIAVARQVIHYRGVAVGPEPTHGVTRGRSRATVPAPE